MPANPLVFPWLVLAWRDTGAELSTQLEPGNFLSCGKITGSGILRLSFED